MSFKIEKPVRFFLKGLVYRFIVGWLFFIPLSIIIPKKDIVTFIPRNKERFADNTKYFYLYLHNLQKQGKTNFQSFYLCENDLLYERLVEARLAPIKYPGLKGFWILLRSKYVVVDSNEWGSYFKPHIVYNSFKVQLWHGVGLKKVGKLNPIQMEREKIGLYKLYRRIIMENPVYQLLVLSSEAQVEQKAAMFNYQQIFINGQSRNDIFFQTPSKLHKIDSDEQTLLLVERYKEKGYKILLYSPTWRFYSSFPSVNCDSLSQFCKEKKLIVIIKNHPLTKKETAKEYDNIIEYNKSMDIYPLLNKIDILITDYSSIYTDFLIFNKPIIFYCEDFNGGSNAEQNLQLDYDKVTPGMKCRTQTELQLAISQIINGEDHFAELRKKTLTYYYSTYDGSSSEKLWRFLE